MKNFIFALAAVLAVAVGASDARAQGPFGPKNSGSSTDPDTGITTTSVRNPDGSRTVTKTDEDGNVISVEVIPAKLPVTPLPPKPPLGGSTTWEGETIIIEINADGSRTIRRIDSDGKETRRNSKDEPVTKVEPRKEPVGGSTSWDGERIEVVINPDGSRTIRKVDGKGRKSERNSKDEPVTKVEPRKEPVGGSTNWDGERIEVVINPDGSRTIRKVDGKGRASERNSKDEPVTKVEPRKEPVGGSTAWGGESTTVELNPDGSKTIRRIGADGKETSETVKPEPKRVVRRPVKK